MIVKLRSGNPGTSGPGGPGDDLEELLEHLDAWSETIIAAGSYPQSDRRGLQRRRRPHLGSGLTIDTAAEQYPDKPSHGPPQRCPLQREGHANFGSNHPVRVMTAHLRFRNSPRYPDGPGDAAIQG